MIKLLKPSGNLEFSRNVVLANSRRMFQLQAKSESLPSPPLPSVQWKAFFCRNQLRSQLKAKIPEIGFYQDRVDTQMVLDGDVIFCQQM